MLRCFPLGGRQPTVTPGPRPQTGPLLLFPLLLFLLLLLQLFLLLLFSLLSTTHLFFSSDQSTPPLSSYSFSFFFSFFFSFSNSFASSFSFSLSPLSPTLLTFSPSSPPHLLTLFLSYSSPPFTLSPPLLFNPSPAVLRFLLFTLSFFTPSTLSSLSLFVYNSPFINSYPF